MSSSYHARIVLPFFLLILILAGLFYGLLQVQPWAEKQLTGEPATDESALEINMISVSLTLPQETYHAGEEVPLQVTVMNAGDQAFHTTFSSACTDPVVFVDNEKVASPLICAQVLTDVSLEAGEEEQSTINLWLAITPSETPPNKRDLLVTLTPGSHHMSVSWADIQSNEVVFYVE